MVRLIYSVNFLFTDLGISGEAWGDPGMFVDPRGETPQVDCARGSLMVDNQDEERMMLCSYCWQSIHLQRDESGCFHVCGHYVARLENQSCYIEVAGADVDLEESS